MVFNDKDLQFLKQKGISGKKVEQQVDYFIKGFPFTQLNAPAVKGNGIKALNNDEAELYENKFNSAANELSMLKFVPASGAATRMFKDLFEFREKFKGTKEDAAALYQNKNFNAPGNFFTNLRKFAFFNDLNEILEQLNTSIQECIAKEDFNTIIDFFLTEKGLNYGALPKGLLKFHQYQQQSRTAMEEHLVEGALYCKSQHTVNIHFTVSPEHRSRFEDLVNEVITLYEKKFKIKYNISFSEQKASTDVIAVDLENKPFRNADGSLLFRPGGHGALIENLNELDAELIFIKNIDNVVPDRLKDETVKYKKALAGYLISLAQQTHMFLTQLEQKKYNEGDIAEMQSFATNELMIVLPDNFNNINLEAKAKQLFALFNRPMRVCGMVKNEGEPGGGPFWTIDSKGRVSLQIVESSQINLKDPEQKEIFNQSTHFNPVDLICYVNNFKGEKFNLLNFIDPETGFISEKSKDGKPLKAQELPGLWNGAMANWITIFVEVPLITFNPVKTVNDLLRNEHQ